MKRAYNIVQVIKAVVDDGDFFELKAKFARNLATLDGHTDRVRSVAFSTPARFLSPRP